MASILATIGLTFVVTIGVMYLFFRSLVTESRKAMIFVEDELTAVRHRLTKGESADVMVENCVFVLREVRGTTDASRGD